MNLFRALTMFLAIYMLLACKNHVEDVSGLDKYTRAMSKTYTSIVGLELLKITSKPDSKDIEEFYVLDREYNIKHKSSEIISRSKISSEFKFKIKKILKCNNCIIAPPIQYQIEIVGSDINIPVYLSYIIRKDIEDKIFQYVKEI